MKNLFQSFSKILLLTIGYEKNSKWLKWDHFGDVIITWYPKLTTGSLYSTS